MKNSIHKKIILLWLIVGLPIAIINFGMGGGWETMKPAYIVDYVN